MNDQDEFAMTLDRAKNGDVLAMFNVAECYIEGIGAPINIKQALRWQHWLAKAYDSDHLIKTGSGAMTSRRTEVARLLMSFEPTK